MFCQTVPRRARVCLLYGARDAEQRRPGKSELRDASWRGSEVAGNAVNEKASWQHALVFAIAHEIANQLGAIRLQAHLLDEDLGPRALAEASIEIDGLAARAGPLLALLRAILSPAEPIGMPSAEGPHWSALLLGLGREIEDEGTRGVRVEIEMPTELQQQRAPGVDWLHPLLMALVGSTLSVVSRRGSIGLGLASRGSETALIVEDDGAQEDLEADAALRGRPLCVSIARRLVAGLGGRVEVFRVEHQTRVELIFPNADS